MRTRDIVLGIKNGDRVVYAANNGVEYNATALDIPHFGFNQALRAPGLFLNMAYFDEAGTVVKISAAPPRQAHNLAGCATLFGKRSTQWEVPQCLYHPLPPRPVPPLLHPLPQRLLHQ